MHELVLNFLEILQDGNRAHRADKKYIYFKALTSAASASSPYILERKRDTLKLLKRKIWNYRKRL